MDPLIYTGRKVQKQILMSFITTAFGSGPSRSAGVVSPRLFLFQGEDGLGKSSLVDLCNECIQELNDGGKKAVSLLLDLDAWRFRNGLAPATVKAMIDSLHALAAGTNETIGAALTGFESIHHHVTDLEAKRESLVRREWPAQLFLGGKAEEKSSMPGKGGTVDFTAWLGQWIGEADLALLEDIPGLLTAALADGLREASKSCPFILMLDGYDRLAGTPAEEWLKNAFLPRLLSDRGNFAVIVSGRSPLVRMYRNAFAEDLLYSVDCASLCLSRNDIDTLAQRRNLSLAPGETDRIENATAGVPLVVHTTLDAAAMNIPLEKIITGTTAVPDDAKRLVNESLDHFIRNIGSEKDRNALFSIAMQYRLDENILSEFWGTTSEETTACLTELSLRYSFMQGRQMHPAARALVLGYLMEEALKGVDSTLAETFKRFSAVSVSIHRQYVEHMLQTVPDGTIRYADPNFQVTLLGLLNGCLWAQQQEISGILPGLFIEAICYAPAFAGTLLSFAGDAAPLLSKETTALVDTLTKGVPATAFMKEPLSSGKRSALKALDFIRPFESGLNDLQSGLLHGMRGRLACIVGSFDKAMESFQKSEELFGAAAPETSRLFDDFLCCGFAFCAGNELKKAEAAIAKAVSLRPESYVAHYRLALVRQSMGEHHAAIAAFEKAVAITPDSITGWIDLGGEYATVGDFERAIAAFTRATELDPQHPAAWFNLGIAYEAVSRFAEARQALVKTVDFLPDHWEAHFALGRSLSALELAQDAIASFHKVVEIKPDCTDAWKALGKELFGIESYERSADSLEKAVLLDPSDAAMWDLLAKAWFGASSYEKAANAAQKAVRIKDDFFSAWVTLGQSYTEQSSFKEAYAAFAKAAELNPSDSDIWVSVGNSLYAQGKYDESITAFEKAVAFHPGVDSIWNNIGLAHQVQQHHAEAIEAFQKAVAINPSSADSWYQLGRSFAELDRHTEAAASFSKTVELTPDAHDAWYRKGLSLSKSGDHVEAIETFIRASEINPTDADIWYQAGVSYIATGNAEDAVDAFSRAITLAANRPEVHYQLGLAQESLGRFEEAVGAYRKAVDLSPEKVDAWYHLGTCLNFLSRNEEALPALQKVLELAPDNTDVLLPVALAAHATGDFAQAVAFYRKVLAARPDSEEALYNQALALHAMSNYAEALAAYQTVVKKWPAKDQAWYNMGLAYHAAGDFTQAVNAYREAARLNPDSPEVWYHMGLVFYATEHYGEAIQAFRKVIGRAPDMYEAWFNIGNAYLVWHEYNDAIEAYEKAALLKPDDFTSWGYLGNACFGAAMYDKALEASGKAFALNSEEPWIMATLALSRLFTGDSAGSGPLFEALVAIDTAGQEVARAVAEIQKALAANPELVGAREILQKLTGEMPPAAEEQVS